MIRGKPVPLEDKLTDLFPLSLNTCVHLCCSPWDGRNSMIDYKASMDWSRLKDIIYYI